MLCLLVRSLAALQRSAFAVSVLLQMLQSVQSMLLFHWPVTLPACTLTPPRNQHPPPLLCSFAVRLLQLQKAVVMAAALSMPKPPFRITLLSSPPLICCRMVHKLLSKCTATHHCTSKHSCPPHAAPTTQAVVMAAALSMPKPPFCLTLNHTALLATSHLLHCFACSDGTAMYHCHTVMPPCCTSTNRLW